MLHYRCFKYRQSRPRYRPISPFLPAADTIWENRSPYRLQRKTTDIWNIGRYIGRYWPINCLIYYPIWNNLFIARLRANVHCFYCLCKHITSFLLGRWYVWSKPTFSYQYFIIYSIWYECACIPDISPDIRYPIWKTLLRYDPDIRYLEPCTLLPLSVCYGWMFLHV